MKQIRIARQAQILSPVGERFATEWMQSSSMNRWLLKSRLKEAVMQHGEGSHWIEVRDVGKDLETPGTKAAGDMPGPIDPVGPELA